MFCKKKLASCIKNYDKLNADNMDFHEDKTHEDLTVIFCSTMKECFESIEEFYAAVTKRVNLFHGNENSFEVFQSTLTNLSIKEAVFPETVNKLSSWNLQFKPIDDWLAGNHKVNSSYFIDYEEDDCTECLYETDKKYIYAAIYI